MTRSKRNFVPFLLSPLLLTACGDGGGNGQAPFATRLEPAACAFQAPAGHDPSEIECGFVVVPEDRARNDGRSVRIAYAVFKASGPSPATDPLVFLDGGPGGPTLLFLDVVLPRFAPFQEQRDLVFFSQRGIAPSEPDLDCPEWRQAFTADIGIAQSVQQDAAGLSTAMLACHDRLAAAGVNFAAYTSAASARDAEDLLLALGYEEWNFYAFSYGTRLGLTALRDTPQHIRSIVLDSVVPVQENLTANFSADFERALDVLFGTCAADGACAAAYPDLEETFFSLVETLNENPLALQPVDPMTGQVTDLVFTGDRLLLGVQQALYDPTLIPFLPLVIDSTAQGDYALLTAAASSLVIPSPLAWGMSYSIECNEEAPFLNAEIIAAATATVRPEISKVGLAYVTNPTLEVCPAWGSPAPPAGENEAVASDAPALLFAGQYDPITRPQYAHVAAQSLSNSFVFEFPGLSHGVLDNRCAQEMVGAFLAAPLTAPGAACVDALAPPAFLAN